MEKNKDRKYSLVKRLVIIYITRNTALKKKYNIIVVLLDRYIKEKEKDPGMYLPYR